MDRLVPAIINGIATGVPLFLVSSGLSLIYGVMGVLNFAHGAFFMIGAYILVTLVAGHTLSLPAFIAIAIVAALAVGVLGFAAERVVFSRLYDQGHVTNLLGSYALMLLVTGAAILVWGTGIYNVPKPQGFAGAITVGSFTQPTYNIFLIIVGVVVAVGLWLLLERTTLGIRIRAVAHDRVTARALGVRATRVGIAVFILGSALAGFAGALDAPLLSTAPGLDTVFIIQSFVVVIVGGLGSMSGALIAAIALGLIDSFLVAYAPGWSQYGMYIAVAIVLLLRPQGLLGRSRLEGA